MARCPSCNIDVTKLVVNRTDTYDIDYLLVDGEWVELTSKQIDTDNFDQYCGHCEAHLGGWGDIGEYLVGDDEED